MFWQQVFAICLVGSLESLLSSAAVDKLDPYSAPQISTATSRRLRHIICGLIGGMPMIAEIVRSSANVNTARARGGRISSTECSADLRRAFRGVIHEIPLASLAALLVFTGYRLASPLEFKEDVGDRWDQLTVS
jgi:MFS superfamily sulfate permease-like transporter